LENVGSLKINRKTFMVSVFILLFLMILSGVLTLVLPTGAYARAMEDGREVMVPDSFTSVPRPDYPVWRWFLAPFEVLGSEDGSLVVMISFFILMIGGAFSVFQKTRILTYIVKRLIFHFEKRKYVLLAIFVFVFMLLGSLMGIFEEVVALVPFMIMVSFSMGWDSLTGLGMSLLATGFGFSAAIANPFSLGIAQQLSGLPVFSGAELRWLIFGVTYLMLLVFLVPYARMVEKRPRRSPVFDEDLGIRNPFHQALYDFQTEDEKVKKAAFLFLIALLLVFLLVVFSPLLPFLSAIVLPLFILIFTGFAFWCGVASGQTLFSVAGIFGKGILGVAPAILLILMASSVKYIIASGSVLDTLLHYMVNAISSAPLYLSVIYMYLLVLGLNLFIGSASAKAFLVMPILAPLADMVGVTRQTAVLAFCLGDGFSNLLYPTNTVLLVALGLTVVGFSQWFKWVFKIQFLMFFLSILFLLFSVWIGYGPY